MSQSWLEHFARKRGINRLTRNKLNSLYWPKCYSLTYSHNQSVWVITNYADYPNLFPELIASIPNYLDVISRAEMYIVIKKRLTALLILFTGFRCGWRIPSGGNTIWRGRWRVQVPYRGRHRHSWQYLRLQRLERPRAQIRLRWDVHQASRQRRRWTSVPQRHRGHRRRENRGRWLREWLCQSILVNNSHLCCYN